MSRLTYEHAGPAKHSAELAWLKFGTLKSHLLTKLSSLEVQASAVEDRYPSGAKLGSHLVAHVRRVSQHSREHDLAHDQMFHAASSLGKGEGWVAWPRKLRPPFALRWVSPAVIVRALSVWEVQRCPAVMRGLAGRGLGPWRRRSEFLAQREHCHGEGYRLASVRPSRSMSSQSLRASVASSSHCERPAMPTDARPSPTSAMVNNLHVYMRGGSSYASPYPLFLSPLFVEPS